MKYSVTVTVNYEDGSSDSDMDFGNSLEVEEVMEIIEETHPEDKTVSSILVVLVPSTNKE